jgi:hypothetical protein
MLISQLAASCGESNHGEVLVNTNSYYSTTSWNVNTCHGDGHGQGKGVEFGQACRWRLMALK